MTLLAFVDQDADVAEDRTTRRPRFASTALLCLWLSFWVLLFLLGLQEYWWQGGHALWLVSAKYATAAVVSTSIGVLQLFRAQRLDHLLGKPFFWFLSLWKWLPLEMLSFVIAMFVVPRTVAWLFNLPYDDNNWLASDAHDSAKFLLFYLLAGGIQFGIHTYWAWSNERLRTAEHARLAQEAQMAQLTQQLQPHFLFNGMNLISSLIHSDPDLADTLLARLATLLRAATSAGRRSEQSLDEELVLLRAYADIMTQRFADRVRLDWDIADDARACLVPTFGLQPLLENCFRHVVEKRTAPTHIVVRARRERDRLHVAVEDDGEHRQDVPVLGVGLGNLKRRLASLHGENARLALVPRVAKGLTVRVEMPCGC